MTRQQVLDLYFLDARHKLLDVAAFLDRVQRASGDADYRGDAFLKALKEMLEAESDRAERVLLAFSDPTQEPIDRAPGKGASGAWQPPAD